MPEETTPTGDDATGDNTGESTEAAPPVGSPDTEGEARPFGGLTAREASQRAAERRQAKDRPEDDPRSKARKALEKKAGQGDVYAARELREHEAYWYPDAASRGDWMQELLPDQRTAVRAIIQWRLAGQQGLPPDLATAQPSAPS